MLLNMGMAKWADYGLALNYICEIKNVDLYAHICTSVCISRGCGKAFVMDGNWKLTHKMCLFKFAVPNQVLCTYHSVIHTTIFQETEVQDPRTPLLKPVTACQNAPVVGKLYCLVHLDAVTESMQPTTSAELRLLKNVTPTKSYQSPVDLLRTPTKKAKTSQPLKDQSPSKVLPLGKLSLSSPTKSAGNDEVSVSYDQPPSQSAKAAKKCGDLRCVKYQGNSKTFHGRTRGYFFVVTPGGHVVFYEPLYG